MITSIQYPDEYSFIGNPMLLKINADSYHEVILSITIENLKAIDVSIYLFGNGSTYKGCFDLAMILGSFFKNYTLTNNNIIAKVENFTVNYTVEIKGFTESIFEGRAFYGGINNLNYSKLNSLGLNMFSYRLRSVDRQFLFTTRTNSKQIVLRENELYPFIFIHPGKTIKVISSNGRRFALESFPNGTVCSINVELLRKSFFAAYNELASFFVVEIDGIQCFNIILTNNTISKNCHILKFRNSLGAYEYIEVAGIGTESFTFSEENSWLSLTSDNFFEENRSRVISQKQITIETGYKTKNELLFILDLIKSDDIYIINTHDYQRREYRCFIKTEELKIPIQVIEPSSITLNLRFATSETFESPEIVFDYTQSLFGNLTAQGRPQIDGFGFIYDDDFPFYAE